MANTWSTGPEGPDLLPLMTPERVDEVKARVARCPPGPQRKREVSAVLAELTAETSASTADAAELEPAGHRAPSISNREARRTATILKLAEQLGKCQRALRAVTDGDDLRGDEAAGHEDGNDSDSSGSSGPDP